MIPITKLRIGQDYLINYEYNAKNDEKTYRFIGTYIFSEPKLVKRSRRCTLNEGNLWLQSQLQSQDTSGWTGYILSSCQGPFIFEYDWGPFIFEYDYEAIRTHFRPILQGIIQNRIHPKNIKYFAGWGYTDFEEFEE